MSSIKRVHNMRYMWVDYAKAIGIILVVFGHVNRGLHSSGISVSNLFFAKIDSIIYSFHMPLFFFLSGLFFVSSIEKSTKKNFILNKINTIFYPYVIWSLLQGGTEVILSKYTNAKTNIIEVLSFPFHPRAQFWFLYALLMIFIFACIIYHHKLFIKTLPIIILASLIGYLFSNKIGTHLHVDYITKNIVFFFIGCLFNLYKNILQKLFSTSSLFLFLFLCSQYLFHLYYKMNYTQTGIFTFWLAIISICLIINLSIKLSDTDIHWLRKIGELSMVIYLMHILAGSGARIILSKVFHIDNWYVHITFGTLIGIVAPVVFYYITGKTRMVFLFNSPYQQFKKIKNNQ